MPIPTNRGSIPVGSIVRVIKTNEFAIVVDRYCMMNNPDTFLHYYIEIEDKPGKIWAAYDDTIELEHLPAEQE